MQFSLEHIAKTIGGILEGSPNKVITGIAAFDEATPNHITCMSNPGKVESNYPCEEIGAIIVPFRYDGTLTNIIRVHNLDLAFAKTILLFHPKPATEPKVSSQANIDSSVVLGVDACISSFATIGARSVIGDRAVIQAGAFVGEDVVIGNDVLLSHNVTILKHTCIGNQVAIQSGTVVGSDGFSYAENGSELLKIPHIGNVVIEDKVDIGACNTIERASLGQTLIKQGVKTGNLVYIAHDVMIGKNTRIGGQAGIASNTKIGDNVSIGPQAGIADNTAIGNHVWIGPQAGVGPKRVIFDRAVIGPQAGIISDMKEEGESAFGTPGMSRRAWLRSGKLIPQLYDMKKEMTRMAQELDDLKDKLKKKTDCCTQDDLAKM